MSADNVIVIYPLEDGRVLSVDVGFSWWSSFWMHAKELEIEQALMEEADRRGGSLYHTSVDAAEDYAEKEAQERIVEYGSELCLSGRYQARQFAAEAQKRSMSLYDSDGYTDLGKILQCVVEHRPVERWKWEDRTVPGYAQLQGKILSFGYTTYYSPRDVTTYTALFTAY